MLLFIIQSFMSIQITKSCSTMFSPWNDEPILEFTTTSLPEYTYLHHTYFFPAQYSNIYIYGLGDRQVTKYMIYIDYDVNNQPILVHYAELSNDKSKVIHTALVKRDSQTFEEYKYEFEASTYESRWMLFLVRVNPAIGETVIFFAGQEGHVEHTLDYDIYGQRSLTQQFGGSADINFVKDGIQINQLFAQYKGILYSSRIGEFYDYWNQLGLLVYFQQCWRSKTAQVDKEYILSQRYEGSYIEYLFFVQEIKDQQMYFQGWFKFDKSQDSQLIITPINIILNNPYQNTPITYIKMQYQFQSTGNTNILITYTEFREPFAWTGTQKSLSYIAGNIQEWHLIHWIFTPATLIIEFRFIDLTIQEEYAAKLFYSRNLNIIIGGTSGQWMFGHVQQLHFGTCRYRNCEEQYICHKSCQTCSGPQYNHCLTCSNKSFRTYNPELQSCQCKPGSVDIDGQPCIQFHDSTVEKEVMTINHQEIYLNGNVACELGYFAIGNECFQCPSVISDNYISCVECIKNPKAWIFNPICLTDLWRTPNSQLFTSIQRIGEEISVWTRMIEIYKDPTVYYFMNGQLQICQKCLKLCLQSEIDEMYSQCRLTQQFHLGLPLYIKCLPQFYQYDKVNNKCTSGYTPSENPPCPNNCIQCDHEYDRCLQCISWIKYFLSIDGKNCLLCTIPNCKYCFHFKEGNRNIQSLSFLFVQQRIDETIKTGCAKCYDGYSYNFETELCELENDFLPRCLQQYRDTQTYCLLTSEPDFLYGISVSKCQSILQFCSICLKKQNRLICLTCDPGYFSGVNGLCQLHNVKEGILSNVLHRPIMQDQWMYEIQGFYYNFIPSRSTYFRDRSEYTDAILITCKPNYRLSDYECIKCPPNCQKCNETGCIECLSISNFKYTLYNGECIQCQSYCNVCLPMTETEILAYNPAFDASLSVYPITRCLQPQSKFNEFHLFLDNQAGVVRLCQKFEKCSLININYKYNINMSQFIIENGINYLESHYIDNGQVRVFSLQYATVMVEKSETESDFNKQSQNNKNNWYNQVIFQNYVLIVPQSTTYFLNPRTSFKLQYRNMIIQSSQQVQLQFEISKCNSFVISNLLIQNLRLDVQLFYFKNSDIVISDIAINKLNIQGSTISNQIFMNLNSQNSNQQLTDILIQGSTFVNTVLFYSIPLLMVLN